MRSRKRFFCSFFETFRKNFRIAIAVARQVALVGVDVLEALLPDLLSHERCRQVLAYQILGMDADDEHLLVVGAVEDADTATLRDRLVGAPQEVVVELLRGRLLEREHLAALGIHAGHHVLDRRILARRVHGLEHEQERPVILGVELLLESGQLGHAPLEQLARSRLVLRFEVADVGGVVALQPEALAVGDPVRRDEPRNLLLHQPRFVSLCHGSLLVRARAGWSVDLAGAPGQCRAHHPVRRLDQPVALATSFRRRAGADHVGALSVRRMVVSVVDVSVQDREARPAQGREQRLPVAQAMEPAVGTSAGRERRVVDGHEYGPPGQPAVVDEIAQRAQLPPPDPAERQARQPGDPSGEQADHRGLLAEQAHEGVGALASAPGDVSREQVTEVALEAPAAHGARREGVVVAGNHAAARRIVGDRGQGLARRREFRLQGVGGEVAGQHQVLGAEARDVVGDGAQGDRGLREGPRAAARAQLEQRQAASPAQSSPGQISRSRA